MMNDGIAFRLPSDSEVGVWEMEKSIGDFGDGGSRYALHFLFS